jgi:hypothetical protein
VDAAELVELDLLAADVEVVVDPTFGGFLRDLRLEFEDAVAAQASTKLPLVLGLGPQHEAIFTAFHRATQGTFVAVLDAPHVDASAQLVAAAIERPLGKGVDAELFFDAHGGAKPGDRGLGEMLTMLDLDEAVSLARELQLRRGDLDQRDAAGIGEARGEEESLAAVDLNASMLEDLPCLAHGDYDVGANGQRVEGEIRDEDRTEAAPAISVAEFEHPAAGRRCFQLVGRAAGWDESSFWLREFVPPPVEADRRPGLGAAAIPAELELRGAWSRDLQGALRRDMQLLGAVQATNGAEHAPRLGEGLQRVRVACLLCEGVVQCPQAL